jgi:nicotinamide-nucleotide amidase
LTAAGTLAKVPEQMSKLSRSSTKVARKNAKPAKPAAKPRRAVPASPKAPVPSRGSPGREAVAPAPVAAAKPAPGTAAVLAIGDEVLRGEVVDSNAASLSDRLFDAGYDVRAHRVVSDAPADIAAALLGLAQEASVVVCTGGLGPTEDDRTVDVVCKVLGVGAVEHAPSLAAMKQRFSAHGFELTPNNLRQVRVPEGAQPFANPAGIAPGFSIRIGEAEAYFLPGIPREMESIFNLECMPRLLQNLERNGVPHAAVRTFHVYGMGESHIDHRLVGLVENLPGATVHFRTSAPENHVKVVVRSGDSARNQAVLDQVDHELRKRIGPGIYGVDGETFPMVVGRTLRGASATLAFAESCTAGYAGQLVTSEPGSSDFFVGGVMAYSNDVKVSVLGVPAELLGEHGAVSEPCARAMAEGVRKITSATLGIAITGIAGNRMDGRPAPAAQPSEKPAGTVCFAVAGTRPTKSTTKVFSGDRERIRKAAAYFALDLARRYFM